MIRCLPYFVLGVAIGLLWALVRPSFVDAVGVALAIILVLPFCEEVLRASVLIGVNRSTRPLFSEKSVGSAVAWGLGFGLTEAVPRWLFSVSNGGLPDMGSVLPLLLHILLSAILWRFVSTRRGSQGLFVCLLLHAAYNTYVFMVTAKLSSAGLALNDLLWLIILANALTWVLQLKK